MLKKVTCYLFHYTTLFRSCLIYAAEMIPQRTSSATLLHVSSKVVGSGRVFDFGETVSSLEAQKCGVIAEHVHRYKLKFTEGQEGHMLCRLHLLVHVMLSHL